MRRNLVSTLLLSIILFCLVSPLAKAQDPLPYNRNMQQVVVQARHDGKTQLMEGDRSVNISNSGEALPYLLRKGWRILSIHTIPNQNPDNSDLTAYFILQKPE